MISLIGTFMTTSGAAKTKSKYATTAVQVTKSGVTVLDDISALYIGSAGTLNIVDYDGNTINSFPAKEGLLPLRVTKVKTGGTATDIWALK